MEQSQRRNFAIERINEKYSKSQKFGKLLLFLFGMATRPCGSSKPSAPAQTFRLSIVRSRCRRGSSFCP
jgi:hypothetical protein